MRFDPRVAEARLALGLISTTDMPRLARDALEAGLDGPAIRRLAALKLAKIRAQEILRSEADPLKHLRDFEHLWIEAHYCRELKEVGNLDDEVYVARQMRQPEEEILVWVMKRIQKLATG